MSSNVAYNVDCMEYLKSVPDKYFDLAVVDPPYGGGSSQIQDASADGLRSTISALRTHGTSETKYSQPGGVFSSNRELGDHFVPRGRGKRYQEAYETSLRAQKISVSRTGGDGGGWKNSTYGKDIRSWDVAPTEEYFNELARVSKNQIIWGGNYFALPPTRCFLVWRKLTISETFTMAMAEYAWTSFNANAKVFEFAPQGKAGDERFHPTQKPIELYAWVYKLFANPGDKILDTHLGSGSSRIAAYDADLDFVGCEIDPVYFKKQEERFERHTAQMNLFLK